MYTSFAEVYDQLMDNVNYEQWADFYRQLLTAYDVPSGKVCECACGTGGLTVPLNRRGCQMTGVDLSQEMLWIAAQKARRQGSAPLAGGFFPLRLGGDGNGLITVPCCLFLLSCVNCLRAPPLVEPSKALCLFFPLRRGLRRPGPPRPWTP